MAKEIKEVYYARSVSWNPDGKRIASLGNRVNVWNVSTGANVDLLDFPINEAAGGLVSWSPDGMMFAFSQWNNNEAFIQTQIWSANDTELMKVGKATTDLPTALTWSPGSRQLAIAFYDSMEIVDTRTGTQILNFEDVGHIAHAAWSPDGKSIAVANACIGACASQKTITILNATTGETITVLDDPTNDILSID